MELDVEKIKELREKLSEASIDDMTCDQRDFNRIMHDDKYANCFLLWRAEEVEPAVNLALTVLKWRKEREIYDLKADDFPDEIIKRGIIYTHGKAKDGSLIVYFVTRQQTKDIKAQVQRLLTLWLERIQQAYPGQSITFLLDVSKSSLANVDLGGIKFMLECFTTNFPGMLERIIILEMPWIMNAIWKVVKQWMTEKQRKKTAFSSFKDLKQYIDPEQLHPYMGGTDTWEYSYPPFPDDIPDVKQQYPTSNGSLFEECEAAENFEDTVADEEFIVNDLEITSTSELPVPQDSSSVIMDDPQVTSSPDIELGSKPKSPETADVLPNGVDLPQDASVIEETPLMQETPEIILSKPKEEKPNRPPQHTVDKEDEIKLGNLLAMSPISEVIFSAEKKDKVSGRYQSTINLRSLTSDDACVAFKVKTTSPERYHVKPSSGKINADGRMAIRISLAPGSEEKVSKDRFLILYQTIEKDENVASFWREHASKETRNEYRVRVKFDQASASSVSSLVVPPTANNTNPNVINDKSFPPNDQLFRLSKEVSSLRRQAQVSQENIDWLQSKLRISLIVQGLLLLLLFFALHKLSAIDAAIELVWKVVTVPTCMFFGDMSYLGGLPTDRPLIIAHRGSSGMLPEHTAAAYKLAVQQGADIIECDLAVTKDLVLICSHDAWLSPTTDVKNRTEFRNKLTTRAVDGVTYTDYFTVDFTFEEIMTLRKIQRFSFRDQSYNGKFPMASFDEYIMIAKNSSNPRTIGIYPETKNPDFFNQIMRERGQKTCMEDLLLASLHKHGYVTQDKPCLIQSFSLSSLEYMSRRTNLPLILLIHDDISDEQLVNISKICYGIGVDKKAIVELKENRIWRKSDFIQRAHDVGLKVHGFTFRNEYMYLAWDYGDDPYREYKEFIEMGIDGLFTDFAWSLSNYMRHDMTS